MKKYSLSSIGNSIVDLLYKTSNEELNTLGLRKGDMLLVDEANQTKIIDTIKADDKDVKSGGSAANTVIAYSQFGGSSAYQSLLGKDELGDFYANEFKELGIELFANRIESEKTGTCAVLVTPDGERTMNTHLGATSHFSLDFLNKDMVANSEWLYIEGYKLSEPESTKAIYHAIEIAKANGTKIALTSSAMFIIETQRENFEKIAEMSDLIFFNDEEAMVFTGEENAEKAFDTLAEKYNHFVVTLGKDGAKYQRDGKVYKVPCYGGKPIDTTGAGDMFAAGYLYGEIIEKNPKLAGHLGSYAAGLVCDKIGPRLENDLKEVLHHVKTELI